MDDKDSTSSKFCSKCKTQKGRSDFGSNRSKSDGLAFYCKPCSKEYFSSYYKKNIEVAKENNKKNYAENRQKYISRARTWEEENPERKKQLRAEYRSKNKDKIKLFSRIDWLKHKEKRLAKKKEYRSLNPERGAEHVRARQTRKLMAMPSWADRKQIMEIYMECRRISKSSGIEHHVDHFYPLKSNLVCGLHNQFNLRIIPAAENQAKGNKLPTGANHDS